MYIFKSKSDITGKKVWDVQILGPAQYISQFLVRNKKFSPAINSYYTGH